MKKEVCNVVSETPTMKEFDCLEMFDCCNLYDIDEKSDEMYDKIYWEKKVGWKHYLEYEVWYDMGGYETNCEGLPNFVGYGDWECVSVEKREIIDFMLGVNYINLNGYYDDKYYGLFIRLDDDSMKLWNDDMIITKSPGVLLNRNIILEQLGI
ncbi:hypothetical protein UFOVP163_15 [uncultured Caudovirales phage]|uniref:Uncharacterized protein n=1 Tax=uncultured Caudovirales phage TaxID=2100421 RepID=A0A6J7WAN9_9CAUD|nr:hypothetical protein UFOVP163_15 [uncultured Caudovirales phage]